MAIPINILIVEDLQDDAELLLAELRQSGFDPKWKRVETEADFLAEIKKVPDIIFSDYSMPQFSGLKAARIVQASGLDIPFILISGTVGEDIAVEAMKHGATDYLLKDRIARLGVAVEHALEQKRLRDEGKRVESLMRQSEERYRSLIDNARDAIFTIATDGTFTSLNPAVETISGVSRADWIGKPFGPMVHPDDLPLAREMFNRILKGEQAPVHELRGHPGLIRPAVMEMTLTAQKDERGKIIGVLGIGRDITERKRNEELLRLLGSAVEQSKESIVITDAELNLPGPRIVFVNPAFTQITGYAAEEVLGKTPRILQGPRTDKTVRKRLRQNLEQGEAFAGQDINYRKDGTEFYLEWQIAPIRNANGKITHFVATQHDITERKQAEGELRWKTAFLEAQVDSNLDAILVVNNHAKVILRNQRLSQLFKIPDDIARDDDDNKMLQYVTGQMKHPKQFVERVAHLYEHPDEIGRDEIELANGTILDRYSAPVRDKAGKYYGRIWTFRDITPQRKLEAQFRQAQKMEGIGQLAGGVAHDFNNILAVIQMQSELLGGGGGLSPDQSEAAEEIKTTVQRAAALTRQLLLFSRREVFQPRDLDLSDSIANTTKMLKRLLGENIQMQLKLASQPMFIHADAGMMDQVLLNLVVNARDAMPNGGRLVIETSAAEFDESAVSQSAQARAGSFVCLSVSDTGCGIPLEILPKIFEPFFTTKGIGKGTGLGLATVFGITQQHQGWVTVESEVDHGTTFRVYLPRLARNIAPKSSQPASVSMRGGNETILLVEDDPSLRVSVRKTLSQLGYRLLEAPTGISALEVWKENRAEISLLLADLVMPDGMTGKELGQRLLRENPELKVIYFSGYSAEAVGKDFPLEEGDNFLAKPFQASKLAQAIRKKLDAKNPA